MRPARAQSGGSQRAFASRDVRLRRSRNATGSPSDIVAAHPGRKNIEAVGQGQHERGTSLITKRMNLPASGLRLMLKRRPGLPGAAVICAPARCWLLIQSLSLALLLAMCASMFCPVRATPKSSGRWREGSNVAEDAIKNEIAGFPVVMRVIPIPPHRREVADCGYWFARDRVGRAEVPQWQGLASGARGFFSLMRTSSLSQNS